MPDVVFGEGDLGRIKIGTSRSYQLTWDDLLWAIRMNEGEAGSDTGRRGAAVLWCMASLQMLRRSSSYKNVIQAYSQPINPIWRRNGRKCRPGGPNHGLRPCSEARLRRRDRFANKPWEDFTHAQQSFVVDWARGRIANPVPKAVDFAVPAVGNSRRLNPDGSRAQGVEERVRAGNAQLRGFFLVWDERGRPIESLSGRGNAFYGRTSSTQSWPDNHVRIVFEGSESQETEPANFETTQNSESAASATTPRRRAAPERSNVEQERIQRLTQGRTATPDTTQPYATFEPSESSSDPNAGLHLDATDPETRNAIFAPYEAFFDQIDAMKQVTTLQLAEAVPVLRVSALDEEGNLVDLNEKLFGLSSFHNMFDTIDPGIRSAERPIASLGVFTATIQSPSVGGATGIFVGTLNIKIHNSHAVSIKHPKGKFLSYMMRQGYYLRIRFGAQLNSGETNETTRTAFQWVEENFFVAQHEIEVNDDLSMDMKLTLLPGSQKLFNQILVGESVPAGTITSQDVEIAAMASDGDQATTAQTQTDLGAIVASYNEPRDAPLMREVVDPETETLTSVLHGAIMQSEIFENPELSAARITNLTNALQTIQARLLTRRYENIIQDFCYQYRGRSRGTELHYPAINFGPLMYRLVKPELDRVVTVVNSQGISVGPVTSLQHHDQSEHTGTRNRILMVFGSFNSKAGQWSDKPISTFPVNLDELFTYLRTERDVGRFGDSLNNFIRRMNSFINEPAHFTVPTTGDRRLEIPEIKYSFYPDPNNEANWIFYMYDNKDRMIQFTEAIAAIEKSENFTEAQVKKTLREQRVPWLEIGTDNSLIRQLNASTTADDTIMSHNLYQANQRAFNQRQRDGSQVPSGMSREWISGINMNPQDVIRSTTLVMPLRLTVNHYIAPTAIIFNPVFLFFPIRQFTGLYNIQELGHEIQKGMVSTNLTLMINITRINRIPDP